MAKSVQTPRKKTLNDYVIQDAAKYFYGSEFQDQSLLHDPASLPRYGYLVRKALQYYAGDLYDPHKHGLLHEPFLRGVFKEIISRKILHRAKDYDWHWIDQMLKRYIGNTFKIDLPYDEAYLKRGYKINSEVTIPMDFSVMH